LKNLLKDWGLALIVTLAVLALWNGLRPGPLNVGPAPSFSLPASTGHVVDFSDFRGKKVIVNFWATWCGPCRSEIPALNAMQAAHGDIPVVGISLDEGMPLPTLATYTERLDIQYLVLHDAQGKVSAQYNVREVPTTFLIDELGEIRGVRRGVVSRRRLEKMLSAL
jgi:peroxiredoxin